MLHSKLYLTPKMKVMLGDQVLALTTHIAAGFQKCLKTGVVLVDLPAAYDTLWKDGLSHKLYKTIPYK